MVKLLKYTFVFTVGVSTGFYLTCMVVAHTIKTGRLQEFIDEYKARQRHGR